MGMYSAIMGKVPGDNVDVLYGIDGQNANDPSLGTSAGFTVMPFAGVLKGLRAATESNITGVGNSAVFTVYKNGVATSVSCTIPTGSLQASDLSNLVTFSSGDYLGMRVISTGVAAGNGVFWNVIIEGSSRNQSYLGGGQTNLNTSATRYYALSGQGENNARFSTESDASMIMANSGTLRKLVVGLNESPGVGRSYTFTVYKNGIATALTGSIIDLDTLLEVSSDVSISIGDTLSLEIIPSGSPIGNDASWACTYSPTVDGEQTIGVIKFAPGGGSSTNWTVPDNSSTNAGWTAGTLNRVRYCFLPPTFTIKSFNNYLDTAPGVGNSREFRLIATDPSSTVRCTISDTATTCSYATPYSITDTDYNLKIGDLRTFAVSSPDATAKTKHTYVFFKQPRGNNGFFDFFDSSGGNNRELCH